MNNKLIYLVEKIQAMMKKTAMLLVMILMINACGNSPGKNEEQNKTATAPPATEAAGSEAGKNGVSATWTLPNILKEISGLSLIDETRMACIQDEKGSLFIYDLKTSQVTDEIKFSGAGDFEGLALVGNAAYALRSDGVLFMIEDFKKKNAEARQFNLGFAKSQDMEGLCYDEKNNRLLLIGKGPDPAFNNKKGIYAFDLASQKAGKKAIIEIDLEDKAFKEGKKKGVMQPSEIGLNPVTGEYYITDRVNRQLLILEPGGDVKKLVKLDKSLFPNPEGLAFSGTGEIYISNEAKASAATIVKLKADYFE